MPGPTYAWSLANAQDLEWSPPLVGDSVVYTSNNTYAAMAKYFGQQIENQIVGAYAGSVTEKRWQFAYTCGAGDAVGNAVYISGNDTVSKADATNTTKNQVIGFIRFKGAIGAASAPAATNCYLQNFLYVSGLSGGTAGASCFLSDTGTYTATPGTVTTRIGTFISTTEAILYAGPFPQAQLNAYLAANGTNATATLATTGLSVSVLAGVKYRFTGTLYVANSQAAEGVQVDFNGGSATMTEVRAQVLITDTALIKSAQVSALATATAIATCTGDSIIQIIGSMKVNAAGTVIPRYAENSHTSGTVTLYKGSNLSFELIP